MFPEHLDTQILTEITSGYIKTLGDGTYGCCRLTQWRDHLVVVKEFKPWVDLQVIRDEVDMLRKADGAGGTPRLLGVSYHSRLILQEFIMGHTIEHLLSTMMLTDDQWLQVLCKMARGLEDLHMKGIIHNDLKSDNVLVNITVSGRVSVAILDLGIARYTGTVWGCNGNPHKYPWMGPEILKGGICSPASDVYGLGFIIHEIQQVLYSQYTYDVLEHIKRACRLQCNRDRTTTTETYNSIRCLGRTLPFIQ